MWLYSPVDLTGNMNKIEKLDLGGTGSGNLSILGSMHKPLCHLGNHSKKVSNAVNTVFG